MATTVSFGPTMTASCGSTWRRCDGSMWPRFGRQQEERPSQGWGHIKPTCDSRRSSWGHFKASKWSQFKPS